jgi:hypothetical protein
MVAEADLMTKFRPSTLQTTVAFVPSLESEISGSLLLSDVADTSVTGDHNAMLPVIVADAD